VIDQLANTSGNSGDRMGGRPDDSEFQSFLAKSDATYQMHNTLRAIDASSDMTREQKDYARSHEIRRTRAFIDHGVDIDDAFTFSNGTLASGQANRTNFFEVQAAGAVWAARNAARKAERAARIYKRTIQESKRRTWSISQRSTSRGIPRIDTFTGVDESTTISINTFTEADKIEIINPESGESFNVTTGNSRRDQTFTGETGTYILGTTTLSMSDVYRSWGGTSPSTITIRVTNHPNPPYNLTRWNYVLDGGVWQSPNVPQFKNSDPFPWKR
jgi:hypothetical protein